MILQKWYRFSKNRTLNFDLFPSKQHAVWSSVVMLGGSGPSQPHEHRGNDSYPYNHSGPRQPFCFLLSEHACMLSCSVMSNSLWPHGLWPARLFCPWDSPGKNTGVGSHFLLQGIFPTKGLILGLQHLLRWQVESLPLSHLGSPTFRTLFNKLHEIFDTVLQI